MELFIGRCLRHGLLQARFARLPLANQALRIPIADYKTQLSLEIGIDGFGVKKHRSLDVLVLLDQAKRKIKKF